MSNQKVNVAVVGATGAVGHEMLSILEERNFPIAELRLLASERSAGKKLTFKGQEIEVQTLTEDSFEGIDIALFSAGGSISQKFVPAATKAGAVSVDNTSAFRMDPNTPLVVPEVNPEAIKEHNGCIANPNCSTIQMVAALKPLHDFGKIKRVVVSTYQSVSGAGVKAIQEMYGEAEAIIEKKIFQRQIFPHQIAFNILPQIPQSNAFMDNGYSEEEMKMINETKKILGDESIKVTATTVRVPVERAHSEAVNVETETKISAAKARELLSQAPGVELQDDLENQIYPLASEATGKDAVFVGRIREDLSNENALEMWVVSDNLRKGAALNTIQIAEYLVQHPELLKKKSNA